MKRAVLVICDGHRRDFLNADTCPNIMTVARTGRSFLRHSAIFPSATRASAASVATGCWPATHGLHGNMMALDDGDGLVVHDVGAPAFKDVMRWTLGRTLKVPTLAERLATAFGKPSSVIFSNVSPGAAYFQDPDHHGYVYHRAGSFGPDGEPRPITDELNVTKDAAGDRAMTERFCREVLLERRLPLAVLWLTDPDTTMHATTLGSPGHLEGVAAADACVGLVRDTVATLREQGDDVLFLIGSDHGHETVANAIPVEQHLIEAGLKESTSSSDLVIAPQGSAAHLYLSERHADRLPTLVDFLRNQQWLGELHEGEELRRVSQAPDGGLSLSISMKKYSEPNEYGIPGVTDVVTSETKPAKPKGFGTHGGLGAYERAAFLIAEGSGFAPDSKEPGETSLVNIAPTIAGHLEIPRDGMDGLPLPKG
jgi:hypothetical protein